LERPEQPVRVKPRQVRQARPRDLLVRFLFGAVTSIVAAVVGIAFGPRAGGVMLAFPATLAASVTLIAEEQDVEEAREDARRAVDGAVALGCFAAVGALLFGRLPGGVVLAIAAATWGVVAIGVDLVAWRGS
jgi:hypothetical protein